MEKILLETKIKNIKSKLKLCEIITMFHYYRYRTFKDYYNNLIRQTLKSYFPNIVNCSRFVKACLLSIFIFSQGVLGNCSDILK